MSTAPIAFEAVYALETRRLAGRAFRDYQFKRYGLLMIAACIINAIALAVMFWSGVKLGAIVYFLVFVVVIGPLQLLYLYFLGPRMYEAKLGVVLAPAGQVIVGSEAVTLPGRRGAIVFPWSIVKVVVEEANFFLLVISPFSSYFVPRPGMPAPAYDALHSKVNYGAA